GFFVLHSVSICRERTEHALRKCNARKRKCVSICILSFLSEPSTACSKTLRPQSHILPRMDVPDAQKNASSKKILGDTGCSWERACCSLRWRECSRLLARARPICRSRRSQSNTQDLQRVRCGVLLHPGHGHVHQDWRLGPCRIRLGQQRQFYLGLGERK